MKTSVRVLLFVFFVVSLIVISFALPAASQTQTPAKLTGSVTDPRGATIAGAQITAEPIPSAGEPVRAVSGNDGRFSLTLAPGRYRITISRDSFAQIIQEITMASGETREFDVRMTLEPLSSKVVITAQTLPLDADSSPAPVTILTRQDIEQRVATSLPDLLATQPGFSIGRTGPEGGQTSLFLDGGNSNHTKVLVDGTPVNQPGGLVDFSNFTLDNIDKVEIVHGAESALYGSDAMDGVIQIFTHRGTTGTPEFTAYAEGGNFSTGRGGAELSGLLRRFDYSAGFADLETQGQGPNDSFRNRTISGNFGWRFSDTARVSLVLRDNGSFAGTPGQTLFEPANLCLNLPAACEDNTRLHNFSANLHTEFTTGSRWRHQLDGTESYIRQSNFDPTFPSFFQYNRSSFVGQSTYQIKGLAVTTGYEYEVENGFVGLHVQRNNQAGFLDARWQPIARLTLNAGARAEDNASFGTRVVPRAGASYALRIANGAFGDTRLRASYGLGIVEPRFDQSFSTDPCFPGDPNLSPEQSRTVHAGIEQKLASDRLRVTVDYFDNQFRNMISFGILSAPPPGCLFAGTFFNTDLARSRGGNLSAEARIARWLSASGNYTYDPTRVLAAPNAFDPAQIPGNRLLRRPVNSGNLVLNAAFKRMNWNISGYFTGRRTDSDFLGLGLNSNPGYARFDLAGSYNLTHGVSFYGRIANLADKKYQDVLGYPALGREYRAGVKYTTRHE
ncbi:MAG: TonB-dependent receptor [Candidatus Acidoferrum typicum]|nr:TonB-dependent receptor [Candidatus Acidoferrum typicum]